MFCVHYEGTQKHGVAPKNQVEARLESILKAMNVWKDRT